MKITASKDLVSGAAKMWKRQYYSKGMWYNPLDTDAKEVYENLRMAETRDDIDGIIGNTSWTMITCDECGESVREAVVLYKETYCYACLKEAVKLLEKDKK